MSSYYRAGLVNDEFDVINRHMLYDLSPSCQGMHVYILVLGE